MTAGLDTAVILRLAVGEPSHMAAVAREFLTGADAPVAVSDLAVAETYHALRHHYGAPHAEAVRLLRAVLADPRIQPTGIARDVIERLPEPARGIGLADRLLHADYARDGRSFVTFDRAAARLPGATRLTA